MRNGTDSTPDKMTNFVSFLSGAFVLEQSGEIM